MYGEKTCLDSNNYASPQIVPILLWSVALPGPWLAGGAEIKVSSIPCCKQRGVNSLQDDRCLQSVGYYSFLCLPIQLPLGIAVVPCNGNLTQQFGNRGMHPVLTFFAKINRAVPGQLCTHAHELESVFSEKCYGDTLKRVCIQVARISIFDNITRAICLIP